MGATGNLLGRDDQLRSIMEAIDSAAPLVLLAGDAGIGKSRLVAQAVADSRARGVVTLVGGCVSLTGKLPLLPFVQALSELSDSRSAKSASLVPASLRPALNVLVPGSQVELPTDRSHGREGWEDPGAWDRERLVLAVGALLSPPARTLPTVLVIEDLHWADPFTLDMLSYLVAGTRTGATCLVTLRTDQRPMPEAVLRVVAEMQRINSTVTVELGPLPPAVVEQQVLEILGRAPPPKLVRELAELSGGNPFFTEQLCRHAAARSPSGKHRVAALPPQLSGFLQVQIRGLSEPARRALLVLGVAGTPLNADQLATAATLSTKAAADAVQELSQAALLAPLDHARLAPRHALLAAAVAEATDPIALADAHARVAELMEGTGDETLAVAVAGHWAAAGRDHDELRATLAAAPITDQMADFDAAAELWTRAYRLAEALPEQIASGGHSLLGIAVAGVRALSWAGRAHEADQLAEDAFQRLTPVQETELGGSLRWWVGHFRAIHDNAAGADMLRDAERVLSLHPPSTELVSCLSRLGRIEDMSGRPEIALQLVERAVEVAREGGSVNDEARATVTAGHVMLNMGLSAQAIERVAKVARRPDVANNVRAQAILAVFESDLLLHTDRLHDARTVAWSAYELMVREGYGRSFDASVLRYNAGEAELELGRTGQVRALVESLTTGQAPNAATTGDHQLRALADMNAGLTGLALERIEQVRVISLANASTEDVRLTAQGLAQILLWARQPGPALEAMLADLELLAGTDQQRWCSELLTLAAAAVADLAAAARARDEPDGQSKAKQAIEWLVQWVADSPDDPFDNTLEGGRTHADELRWRAEQSRAAGASDPGLWRSAAQEWESQSRAHRAGYCWWRLAQAQVDQGDPTSSIGAALQRAYALSAEMVPQREAVEALAQRAKVRLTTRPSEGGLARVELPVALTVREQEILRHVAAGRSNTQIARDLFISDKTVSVHVSNLLRKIGVSNRVQAAAWADEVGAFEDLPGHARP